MPAKKKTVKKKVEKIEPEKKFLTTSELIQMREAHLQNQIHRRNMVMSQQKIDILKMQLEKAEKLHVLNTEEFNNFVKEHGEFKDSIAEKYELPKEGFHFDGDTGEVVGIPPIKS